MELEQRKTNSYFLHIINNKDLLECDNELGMELFYNKRGTAPYLRKGTDELSKKDVDFYKYVISTTDKTNFNARNAFFENYCIRALDENGNTRDDIKRLFMRMDEDKHLRKTFELLSAYGHGIAKEPIDKLLYYIDSFGTKEVYKKLDRFIKIADVNLAHDKKPEEIVEAISKNLNNKYYQTSGMKKQEADKEMLAGYELFFPKTKVAILKLKNKMKYSIMPKIFGTGTPAPINKNATYRKPVEEILTAVPQPIIPQPTPTIKRDFKAKKLQIQQDAQEIIKSRMKSAKQIEEQTQIIQKNHQK